MLAAALCLSMLLDAPAAPVEVKTLRGEVVELAAVFAARKLAADAAIAGKQVVLRAADGTVTPLLCEDASRALFLDARLRDRRAELKVRLYPGLPYAQVTSFRVEEGGVMRSPEYWCDVCAITVRYDQTCPCCQGPMVLRMKPE